MSDTQEIIIVRRYEEEEGHHGGAWKIALADFMTAMMALFLVMWLLNATDENTRNSVANYFNPIQLAESSPNKKGLQEPQTVPPDNETEETKDGRQKGSGEGTGGKSHQLQKPRFKEGMLFQDPYAVLAKIAAEVEPTPHDTLGADVTPGESDVPGLMAGEAPRDPFDPLYWQVTPVNEIKTETTPKPGTAMPAPLKEAIDALVASGGKTVQVSGAGKRTMTAELKAAQPTAPIVASDADQQAAGEQGDPQKAAQARNTGPKKDELKPADYQAAELKNEISKALELTRDRSPSPQIEVRRTGAGTLISLTDDINFSMFAVGSAEPQPKVVQAMAKIAKILQARDGKIVVRGHTDARPFRSENYDNWRLSQARAQMALYMLVRGGLPEDRIVAIEGHADRDPKIPSDPNADQNRRIEILLKE
ncbi:MotB family protein [Microvirga massiliensis]|uniref:MotB family protein n=1 Tax=Microvirga massiliensis TaxID=1033741 RepID=UPI0006612799|nr:MotB family protein [Microvirga massiliensis]